MSWDLLYIIWFGVIFQSFPGHALIYNNGFHIYFNLTHKFSAQALQAIKAPAVVMSEV